MVITRMTDSREVEAIAEAAKREALEQLSKWIGFRKVIDALKGKPVIGHNMFLDLIHTVNKFQAGYVGSLDDWKGAVWGMFGRWGFAGELELRTALTNIVFQRL